MVSSILHRNALGSSSLSYISDFEYSMLPHFERPTLANHLPLSSCKYAMHSNLHFVSSCPLCNFISCTVPPNQQVGYGIRHLDPVPALSLQQILAVGSRSVQFQNMLGPIITFQVKNNQPQAREVDILLARLLADHGELRYNIQRPVLSPPVSEEDMSSYLPSYGHLISVKRP